MTIDNSIKQLLLDSLAEEPEMVIATAIAYAKNYVNYGEDITKSWTTAVQQASVLEQVRRKAWVEAYDSFNEDYENRLKADMVTMLAGLQQDIEDEAWTRECLDGSDERIVEMESVSEIIQQKISELRGEEDGNDD